MRVSKMILAGIVIVSVLIGWFIGNSHGESKSFDECHAATIDYNDAIEAYQQRGTPQNSQRQHEAFEIYKRMCDR